MKILTTPRLERCIGCHSCSLACARLVHQCLSWDMAGIRIASSGGLSTGFEARNCLACNPAPCAAITVPKVKNTLAERILPESQVLRLIAFEPHPRNRVLLRLLYAAGLRVREICGLKWRDVQERENAGQVTVWGKGGKPRTVLLSQETWKELIALKGESVFNAPVFPSRKGR